MKIIKELTGNPAPLGLSFQQNVTNFAIYSENATLVIIGLFRPENQLLMAEYPMQKTGNIWHIAMENVAEETLYAFRCLGPYEPENGNLYNKEHWIADPYAKIVQTTHFWADPEKSYFSIIKKIPDFDWEGIQKPNIATQDLIIYEMHVRGFTKHNSSNTENAGSYLGVVDKIQHFKNLGINAVELMPVFEFDEVHCKDLQPLTGDPLPNYWGYNTLFFFSPMRRFAKSTNILAPITEFKTLVKELHRNNILVILDVVFNHTGEGNERSYYISFRGIDNKNYYMVNPHGHYLNYSGCGNTVNSNHPMVDQFILDCLTYWIDEMQVDGFRFDLASILTRGPDGSPMQEPPVVTKITKLCKEKKALLIAEAWDAGGLYQVGHFPSVWKYWADWNGKFRDTVRKFVKGTSGIVGDFADCFCGSQSVYHSSETPLSSVNFITAHDGFCLRDLVTYQIKHNYDNGEMNNDGANDNHSWNCGSEGPTTNIHIINLRERQIRNFLICLFFSQGIPMLLMGDEYGHTRKGNNNPFVQDNELNWFLWNLLEKNEKFFNFVAAIIAFRKKHTELKHTKFLTDREIQWHGLMPNTPNWHTNSHFIACTLSSGPKKLFLAFNAHNHDVNIKLPSDCQWNLIVRTDRDFDQHRFNKENLFEILPTELTLPAYTTLIAKEI